MLKRFLPQDGNFFKLFREAVNQLVAITAKHQELVNNLAQTNSYLQEMQLIERAGDKTISATFNLLHKTFITPFDRHDIHNLASRLDSLVDEVMRNALTIQVYELQSLPAEVAIIVNSSCRCANMMKTAVEQLESLKNTAEILKCCDAVGDAEDTAQELILTSIGRLFKDEHDLKQLLKTQELLEGLKNIMGGFQELANTIRTIVLEYA